VATRNRYFSAKIVLNYGLSNVQRFELPFQYGYDDHYIDMTQRELEKQGIIQKKVLCPLWRYCEENNIILRAHKQKNCPKRELFY